MDEQNVQLTEEQMLKLKSSGALGFKLDATFPYVPEVYRDSENKIEKSLWPVFTLKGIDGVRSSELEDSISSDVSYKKFNKDGSSNGASFKLHSGKARIETLRLGLITWKNFRNDKGELIAKPKEDKAHGGIERSSLRVIHPKLQAELVNAITEQKQLTEEERLGLE